MLNNRDLNQVTWEMRIESGDPKFEASQQLPDFPYAGYAEMLGFVGVKVDAREDVGAAWERVLSADRPALLEAWVDPDISIIPPHITFEQANNLTSAFDQEATRTNSASSSSRPRAYWPECFPATRLDARTEGLHRHRAATGIGRAIATKFVREGAAVVIDYVGSSSQADELTAALKTIGGRAKAIEADVGDAKQVATLVRETVREFGRLDVLVNNAGVEHKTAFVDTPERDWNEVLAVNLTGPFLCSQQRGQTDDRARRRRPHHQRVIRARGPTDADEQSLLCG